MKAFFNKIEISFKKAMKGEENIKNIIWMWGATFYIFAFFIIDEAVRTVNFISFDIVVSFAVVVYAFWHLYVLIKCAPKKPKLTKEEKKRLKAERKKDLSKKILRKLFLKESMTKTNPVFVTAVLDVFFIAHFSEYLF